MIVFKIFGIEFKVSFLFLCLISWALLYDENKILLIYIFSSFFHEISHILAIYVFSGTVKQITFTTFGISIKKTPEFTFAREIFILSAGCLGNLTLVLFFLYLDVKLVVLTNIFIIVFNMLPLEKFDGGQVLKLSLDKFSKSKVLYKLFKVASIMSIILLLIYFYVMIFYIKHIKFTFIIILLLFSYLFESKM